MRRSLLLALTVTFALAGCGDDGPEISTGGAVVLGERVTAARAAIAAGDPSGADDLLRAIDADVAELRTTDDISASRAEAVLAALAQVRAELGAYAATSTTSATTTTQPPRTTTTERGNDNDHDGNDRRGNGNEGPGKDNEPDD
ncbi:MAG: hypothetical protein ACRDV7_08760 [Acidimicrobiia bacterium]